jgi:hypothetical protein
MANHELELKQWKEWRDNVMNAFFSGNISPAYDFHPLKVRLQPNYWIDIEGGTSAILPNQSLEQFIKANPMIFPGIDLGKNQLKCRDRVSFANNVIGYRVDHYVPLANGDYIPVKYSDEIFSRRTKEVCLDSGFSSTIQTIPDKKGELISSFKFRHFPIDNPQIPNFPDPLQALKKYQEKYGKVINTDYRAEPQEIFIVCDNSGSYKVIKKFLMTHPEKFSFEAFLDNEELLRTQSLARN